MTRLLCVIALATACGGRPGATAHPEPRPAPDAGSTVTTTTPSRDEHCAKLIAHAVVLGVAERPADQKLTDDERAAIEAQLRADLGARCDQLTQREYDCAMAAPTLAAVQACGS